jgi:hypothetical protein
VLLLKKYLCFSAGRMSGLISLTFSFITIGCFYFLLDFLVVDFEN